MSDKYVAYVGSYTRGSNAGLYTFHVDLDQFTFELKNVFEISNPSFVRLSHDKNFLYTTCDEGVASFKILKDGELVLINKASVNGLRPCYLSVDKDNHYLVAAGYHDGKLTVLKIEEDGSIGGVTDEIFMKGMDNYCVGKSCRCHVNCALFTPDEKYVLAVDLGMDQVKIYAFDKKTGKLHLHDIIRCELESGPKHMIFSHDQKYAYLTHENSNMVTQFIYHQETGNFEKLGTVSTLPEKYSGSSYTVTLKLTDDDRYLYVTNSGNNSVAVIEIDPKTKAMTQKFVLPVSGEYPRDVWVLSEQQKFMSINQISEEITFFKVDYQNNYMVMCRKPVSLKLPTSVMMKKL